MRQRVIILLSLFLLLLQGAWAQNHLVTHRFIHQKVAEGYFIQRAGTTIPQDDFCINVTEAKNWLHLNESYLPTDGRMPWWSELVPGTPTPVFKSVRVLNLSQTAWINQILGLEDFFLSDPLMPHSTVIEGQYHTHWGSMAVMVSNDDEYLAVELYAGGILVSTMAVPQGVEFYPIDFDINGYKNSDFEIRLRSY